MRNFLIQAHSPFLFTVYLPSDCDCDCECECEGSHQPYCRVSSFCRV
jgi:hypothetical protein